MTSRKIEYWVIPPKADAEFTAAMEDVLEVYATPHDPACPVLCMDEQPVQLLKEVRTPIPATRTAGGWITNMNARGRRTSSCSPSRWRAGVRSRSATKTKVDWAVEVARLLEGRYAACDRVILVCDNLNTHTPGAFYEAFEPSGPVPGASDRIPPHAEARQLVEHRRERAELAHASMRDRPPIRRLAEALRRDTSAWSPTSTPRNAASSGT